MLRLLFSEEVPPLTISKFSLRQMLFIFFLCLETSKFILFSLHLSFPSRPTYWARGSFLLRVWEMWKKNVIEPLSSSFSQSISPTQAFFVNFLLTKNYKTQFVSTQKLLNTLKYEKSAHIILTIMTPLANFINVLRPFLVRNFGAKNYKAETVLASVKRSLL